LVGVLGAVTLGSGACGGRTSLDQPLAFDAGGASNAAGSVGSAGSVGFAGVGFAGGGVAIEMEPPSCVALPANCGPGKNEDCCDTRFVSGGKYNRSNDPAWPATVSDFRLDRFEATVGRFRQFVGVYTQDMIPDGAGKNPNNPKDPGWDAKHWNSKLATDRDALSERLRLKASGHTWTTKPTATSETLAINNMSWYEAEAFCIWDGGRLPTAAEWNYAAEGGAEQRVYPWSRPASSTTIDQSYAVYYPDGNPPSSIVQPVGSTSPTGDGRYGQADLSGNVAELVQDFLDGGQGYPHTKVCTDCAYLTAPTGDPRDALGGHYLSFSNDLLNAATISDSVGAPPDGGFSTWGVRCARSVD
ncbi:MAG TPA: SUMF1/EgtB/PvdO family nonheme iron enzyme, partial [Polyangiaceae bacterium]